MRKQFLCTASAIALSVIAVGPGVAADLTVKARPAASPIMGPVSGWTGFYVGAHLGAAWSRHSFAGDSDADHIGSGDISGATLGFHAGYNWQFSGNWLLGIEGDGSFTPLDKTFGNAASDTHLNRRIDFLASVRGRLGLIFDRTLIYATGGVAWTRGHSDLVSTGSCKCGKFDASGGVVGGGVEWKFSQASARIEALHYIFDKEFANDATHIDKLENVTVVRAGLSWNVWP